MSSMNGSVLWTRAMATAIDEQSIQRHGIPALDLMERAGRAVADVVARRAVKKDSVLILAGRGNNGGDALVVARCLQAAGWNVKIFEVTEYAEHPGTPSYEEQKRRALELEIPFKPYESSCLGLYANESVTIVDGILGLGFSGQEVRSQARTALKEAASLPLKTVIAVDIPSGVGADDWQCKEAPLAADITVTFGAAKPAHVLSPSRAVCGELVVADIAFAEGAIASVCAGSELRLVLADAQKILENDPWTSLGREAHKYDRGHVLVLGGSEGKWGAPILAGLAALRCGAGWVTLGLAPAEQPRFTALPPDLTYEHFSCGKDFDWDKVVQFIRERRVRTLVVGPGMMHSPLTEKALKLLQPLMQTQSLRCVFDAGALLGLGDVLEKTPLTEGHVVITPHPGEWQKLCARGMTLGNMEDVQTALDTLQNWGVAALYKSATPLALNPESPQEVYALDAGTTALAKAGSGDVLSGAIAAQLLAHTDITQAMLRGQCLLYRAAKQWNKHHYEDGMIPSDLLSHLAEKL